jgi:hypothetical protein
MMSVRPTSVELLVRTAAEVWWTQETRMTLAATMGGRLCITQAIIG